MQTYSSHSMPPDARPTASDRRTPARLIDHLRGFNTKERFFLVAWAFDNPAFRLGEPFRGQLGRELGLPIPTDAYAAIDYHINWLYASLWRWRHPAASGPYENAGHIMRNAEDIDLLVAFEREGTAQIVMVEAKCAGSWDNGQLTSKLTRLGAIFGPEGDRWPGVVPHYVLASPRRPRRVRCDAWPGWALRDGAPRWTRMPAAEGQLRVARCDERGRPSDGRMYWTALP